MAFEDIGDGYQYNTETGEVSQIPNATYQTPGWTETDPVPDDSGFSLKNTLGFDLSDIGKLLSGTSSYGMLGQLAGLTGAGALLNKVMGSGSSGGGGFSGYQGGIPTLTASREMLPIPTTTQDASGRTVARRPGSGGVTYFSPMQYLTPGQTAAPVNQQASGIANLPAVNTAIQQAQQRLVPEGDAFYQSPEYKAYQNDASNMYATQDMYNSPYFGQQSSGSAGRAMDRAYEQYRGVMPTAALAGGGITSLGGYSDGGQLLRGPGDGVSDDIPATIGNRQPARLADGEFVVPARIVSELGNGSTDAGARKLYAMMDRIKASRAKAKNIAADTKASKHLPA
jgi:hypothetical protein